MTPGLAERHPLKEKRRANKPLLERKRRARINDSLSDLKTLVLSSLNKDVSKYAKMEKVDILDMTVQFLKGNCFEKPVDEHVSIYRAGFAECTQQIYHSIMAMEGLDHQNKYKILSKISERIHPVDDRHLSPPPSPNSSYYQPPVPCPPTRMRPPAPTSSHNPHYEGPPPSVTTRQFNDNSLSGAPMNDPKCKKTLFTAPPAHRGVPTNIKQELRVPSFAHVYGDLPPDKMDHILLRNTGSHLYPGDKVPIRKVYASVPVDEIIAKNAKLYSSEHSDGVEETLARGRPSPPLGGRSPSLSSPPLHQDEQELMMRRHSMVHSGKSGVWRPW